MKVGVALPAAIAGTEASRLLEWARRADAGPFSSLGIIDRLVYPGYDPLLALAAAAAVTSRIQLMPTVLVAPLYRTGVLAKQVLSLDALSGGRLTLGLAVGMRQDDFQAAPATYRDRGRRFEQQLQELRQSWATGQVAVSAESISPLPPRPGSREILIGGYSPAAISRVGRYGDGFIAGAGLDMASAAGLYGIARASWEEAGRPGRPRFVGVGYFALGQAAVAAAPDYLRRYYAFLGPLSDLIATSVSSSPAAVAELIAAAAAAGMDELVLAPCTAALEELEGLAEVVGQASLLATAAD